MEEEELERARLTGSRSTLSFYGAIGGYTPKATTPSASAEGSQNPFVWMRRSRSNITKSDADEREPLNQGHS